MATSQTIRRRYKNNWPSVSMIKRWKLIGGIAAVVIIIAICILVSITPHNYFIKDLFVSDATITECYNEDNNYYVKVMLNNPPKDVFLDDDNTWATVDEDFYHSHSNGDQIGVLVCNYDVYKEKYFGLFGKQGQVFSKNMWAVETAYTDLAAAQADYTFQQFSDTATVKNKVTLHNGDHIIVLDYQGREMTTIVSPTDFSQYKIGKEIKCDFEGYGDFLKIVNIEK